MFDQYFRDLKYNFIHIFEDIFIERDFKELADDFNKLIDDNIVHPFRSIKYGIERLWIWFPIIWFDRDWDHYYINRILKKKLELTSDHITKHANHLEWEKTVKSLDFCIRRLNEIQDGEFTKTLWQKHEEKYGKTKMFSFPSDKDENGKILTYECKFLKTKVSPRNEELVKEENESFRKIIKIGMNREYRCYRLLGQAMGKYMPSWWD